MLFGLDHENTMFFLTILMVYAAILFYVGICMQFGVWTVTKAVMLVLFYVLKALFVLCECLLITILAVLCWGFGANIAAGSRFLVTPGDRVN